MKFQCARAFLAFSYSYILSSIYNSEHSVVRVALESVEFYVLKRERTFARSKLRAPDKDANSLPPLSLPMERAEMLKIETTLETGESAVYTAHAGKESFTQCVRELCVCVQ